MIGPLICCPARYLIDSVRWTSRRSLMSANTSGSQSHFRTCPLCEGMCGVELKLQAGRVESIRPDKANVWSRGHICPKGTALGALHEDADRIRRPLIRDNDTWREVSW